MGAVGSQTATSTSTVTSGQSCAIINGKNYCVQGTGMACTVKAGVVNCIAGTTTGGIVGNNIEFPASD